jgi:ATP-binding protein involved in chromosome partitioning
VSPDAKIKINSKVETPEKAEIKEIYSWYKKYYRHCFWKGGVGKSTVTANSSSIFS